MGYIVKKSLLHNTTRYASGDEIGDISKKEAARLVEAGVIEELNTSAEAEKPKVSAKAKADKAGKTAKTGKPGKAAKAKAEEESAETTSTEDETAEDAADKLPEGIDPKLVQ